MNLLNLLFIEYFKSFYFVQKSVQNSDEAVESTGLCRGNEQGDNKLSFTYVMFAAAAAVSIDVKQLFSRKWFFVVVKPTCNGGYPSKSTRERKLQLSMQTKQPRFCRQKS